MIRRVVSWEISGGKFPEIYSDLSENYQKFLNITYINQLFPSPAFQTDAVISMFLTNNCPDLCALTSCIGPMFRKNILFLARLYKRIRMYISL